MSLFQLKADLATAAPHERLSLMHATRARLEATLHELDAAPITDAAAVAVARRRVGSEVVAVDALIAAELAPVASAKPKAPPTPAPAKPAASGGTT